VSEFLDGHDGLRQVIFVCFDLENHSFYSGLLNKERGKWSQ
jgi:hypothetical protein